MAPNHLSRPTITKVKSAQTLVTAGHLAQNIVYKAVNKSDACTIHGYKDGIRLVAIFYI